MGDIEDEQLREVTTTEKESNFYFLEIRESVSPRNCSGTSVRLIMSFFGRLILSSATAMSGRKGQTCSSNCTLHTAPAHPMAAICD